MMNISSIYMPNRQQEHKMMIDYLQCEISTWNLANYHFIGQDSTLVGVNSKYKNADLLGKYRQDTSNKKASDIINLAEAYNIYILNTFFGGKRFSTWISFDGKQRQLQIDHILATKSSNTIITDCFTSEIGTSSNRSCLTCKISLKMAIKKKGK